MRLIVVGLALTLLAGCAGKRVGGISDQEGAAIAAGLKQHYGARP